MIALLERLSKFADLEISVACVAPGLTESQARLSGNLRFYPISQGPAWRPFAFSNLDNNPRYLEACVDLAQRIKPDIIHIHGTERFYGLIGTQGLSVAPVVVSLQGLLHDYIRYRHHFGVMSLKDVIGMHDLLHLVRGMGPLPAYLQLRRAAERELAIMKGNRWFMGRTLWDRAHLLAANPKARYFYVPELLRSSFYHHQWDVASCQPHRIIFTNANSFRRGVEILLDALVILRHDFPDIRLALAGGVEQLPYGKRLQQRIARLGLEGVVGFLGRLTEEQMAAELEKAHVFAISSLIENSPNSLCEAQLVGVPCIASYVGGIPSLVEEGRTGLFFPSGDAAVLAERIREIFVNDDLACKLGAQARQLALIRNDPETVVRTVLNTYESVIYEAEAS